LRDRQVGFRAEKVVDEVDVNVDAEVDANHPFPVMPPSDSVAVSRDP
jgi:hypothetical protein